ncbi:putative flippase GtrA [Kribbella aluminosa]|uniref:Flippase GtrA n=1 Tax=Kribbella aluminosa TaxID=416017 RepID=A0ABS4UNF9_9ACTN|nr:GtrA family protein [Kribbella aluminosa]MBP2353176.1 putative flippase GtrA [Kribbella aluminosa]
MASTTHTQPKPAGERFTAAMTAVTRRLPGKLSTIVPPSLLGFALINGFTFGVDLALLTALRSWARLPLWVAITIAYCSAFALSYVLNRAFNFRSHAPVGPQLTKYAIVVAVNYFALILGLTTALSAGGLEYHLSRITAGLCEGIFMYCALRWLVFRQST